MSAWRPAGALTLLALLTLWTGCGDDDTRTRYGAVDVVRSYRMALEPIIVEVSAIEGEVAARAVDDDGSALDARLAVVYEQLRPRLVAAQAACAAIQPPRRLRALHADIEQLLQLRLAAYQLVIDTFPDGDVDDYRQAERWLRDANERIADINLQLCDVDVALGDLDDCRLLARRLRPAVTAVALA